MYKNLQTLVEIDSPSGFTEQAEKFCLKLLKGYGYKPYQSNKNAVIVQTAPKPKLAIAAHLDTLGAIVSGINPNGTLAFSKLGGPKLASFEGHYCRIYTIKGKIYTGTLLLNNPSTHVHGISTDKTVRSLDNMHIRIDENVENKKDVQKLGIQNGDIICFDTHYQEIKSGYIKSRFMDNKAGCYVLFEIARRLAKKKKKPAVELFFSNYEEVGHGAAAGYSSGIKELLVIDMGVLGDECEGRETHCSICAKDSSGPYDYNFRKRLVQLADKNKIPYKLDVYPFYGSDGSAAFIKKALRLLLIYVWPISQSTRSKKYVRQIIWACP